MTHTWTPEHLTLLEQLWNHTTLSARQIAKQIGGITKCSVIAKARRLHLKPRASPIKRIQNYKTPNTTIPAPRGCQRCRCGVFALPGLPKCYTCSERGSHV